MHRELDFVAQQLVDNGYSNCDIQDLARKTLDTGITSKKDPVIVGRKLNYITVTLFIVNIRKMR